MASKRLYNVMSALFTLFENTGEMLCYIMYFVLVNVLYYHTMFRLFSYDC